MLTLSEFKRRVTAALEEYFDSEDCAEAIRAIAELACPDYHYEVVKRAISLALDRGDRDRELVSRFLSASYPSLLPVEQLGKGFERLFEYVDDLELDVPGASQIVAQFLSRALVDEILPPSFLTDPVVAGLGGEVVQSAKRMLSRDHTHSRVERIWGPGDGRPVDELKVEMDALLAEYLVSHDATEAARCVRLLACGHFLHEFVKRAVVLALDHTDAHVALDAVANLFEHLAADEVLSKAQLEQGLAKLKEKLPDLALDAPMAPDALAALVARAKDKGLVDASFAVDW
jgi:programmed cell death protein 4